MLTEREIHKIRSRFPIFSRKIYLNSCSQGARCDVVEAGIRLTRLAVPSKRPGK